MDITGKHIISHSNVPLIIILRHPVRFYSVPEIVIFRVGISEMFQDHLWARPSIFIST